jgi:hypothetical protein
MLLTVHASLRVLLSQVPTMKSSGRTPSHLAHPARLATQRLLPVVFPSVTAMSACLGTATAQAAAAAPRSAEETPARTMAPLGAMQTTESARLVLTELDSRSTFWPKTSFTSPTLWLGLALTHRQTACQSLHRSKIQHVSRNRLHAPSALDQQPCCTLSYCDRQQHGSAAS